MAADVTIFAALFAGLVSFLSPCVLPLVPPYLVYLAGTSLERLADKGITDVIVGFRNAYETDTMPLQQKIDALRGYADRIITKAP